MFDESAAWSISDVLTAQLFGARRALILKEMGVFLNLLSHVSNHPWKRRVSIFGNSSRNGCYMKLMLYDAICYYLYMMLPCLITSWFCHVARPWLVPSAHLHLMSQRGRTQIAKDEEGAPTHDVWADRWTGRTWQWLGIWMLKPCIQGM